MGFKELTDSIGPWGAVLITLLLLAAAFFRKDVWPYLRDVHWPAKREATQRESLALKQLADIASRMEANAATQATHYNRRFDILERLLTDILRYVINNQADVGILFERIGAEQPSRAERRAVIEQKHTDIERGNA